MDEKSNSISTKTIVLSSCSVMILIIGFFMKDWHDSTIQNSNSINNVLIQQAVAANDVAKIQEDFKEFKNTQKNMYELMKTWNRDFYGAENQGSN